MRKSTELCLRHMCRRHCLKEILNLHYASNLFLLITEIQAKTIKLQNFMAGLASNKYLDVLLCQSI